MKSSDSLRRAVERGLADTVAFLQELVRVPSLLGNEEPAQRLVEDRLRELGFDVRSIEPSAERLACIPTGASRSSPTRAVAASWERSPVEPGARCC